MSENVCLAVDSACDLPAEFIQQNNIRILPINLKFENQLFVDNRDPARTVDFYTQGMLEKNIDAETVPLTAQEMSKILEQELVLEYDKALAITIMNTRSEVYKNIRDAVFISQPKFKQLRSDNGLDRGFRILVMDSNTLFTGQGVMVYEAARLLKKGSRIEEVIMHLESLKNHVRAFLMPRDLYHLKNRATTKGDNSVSWLSYQLGNMLNVKPIIQAYQGDTAPVDKAMGFESGLEKLFNTARHAIDQGLGINVIVMSYAGPLAEIEKEKSYQDFVGLAQGKGVPTLLSVMSTTAAVNVGPGSFSLAYADKAN
jgi:DegV family protein with EDD domain